MRAGHGFGGIVLQLSLSHLSPQMHITPGIIQDNYRFFKIYRRTKYVQHTTNDI